MEKAKAKPKKGLGRGLDAYFEGVSVERSSSIPEKKDEKSGVIRLKMREVEPNPKQPRKVFDKEKLEALASSIREHGVIQPILVKEEKSGMYTIIAGERRWRAAKLAGLSEIPCVVGEYSPKEIMEIALVENLQREDLNPMEEAEGYEKLMETFSLTQEEVAKRVGKSRSAVANSLRLNGLPQKIKKMVTDKELSQGHARTLLGLSKEADQIALAERIIKEDLSVRQTEALVASLLKNKKSGKKKLDKNLERYFKNLSDELSEKLKTKVSIKYGKNRGKIEIEYYSNEELENIVKKIK